MKRSVTAVLLSASLSMAVCSTASASCEPPVTLSTIGTLVAFAADVVVDEVCQETALNLARIGAGKRLCSEPLELYLVKCFGNSYIVDLGTEHLLVTNLTIYKDSPEYCLYHYLGTMYYDIGPVDIVSSPESGAIIATGAGSLISVLNDTHDGWCEVVAYVGPDKYVDDPKYLLQGWCKSDFITD